MSTGRSTRRRWFQFGLLVIAGWMLVGWLSYKTRDGRPVEFIVPMNFQGTIEVVLDADSGESMELKNGSYVLTVPQSGVIFVTDTGPFRRWHKAAATMPDSVWAVVHRSRQEARGILQYPVHFFVRRRSCAIPP
jgi:hypothetical protein